MSEFTHKYDWENDERLSQLNSIKNIWFFERYARKISKLKIIKIRTFSTYPAENNNNIIKPNQLLFKFYFEFYKKNNAGKWFRRTHWIETVHDVSQFNKFEDTASKAVFMYYFFNKKEAYKCFYNFGYLETNLTQSQYDKMIYHLERVCPEIFI